MPKSLYILRFCWALVFLFLSEGVLGQESPAQSPPAEKSVTVEVAPDSDWAAYGQRIADAEGIDDKIDVAFSPVADTWESIVLASIPLGSVKIPIVVALLGIGATCFTFYFAFVNIRCFPLALKVVMGKFDTLEHDTNGEQAKSDKPVSETSKRGDHHGEVSHFQALATAVSGTVGLGNIGGVAVAISTGGPGATFWMIVCGLLGMSTKFVECTLGVAYRDIGPDGTVYGGPMYYLNKGLSSIGLASLGKSLAFLFAVLCIGASFGGGNAFQSNQATAQIVDAFFSDYGRSGSLKFTIGCVIAVFVGLVIIGGIKRIATVTEKMVPLMAIIYIVACLVVIMVNIQLLGTAISQIFTEAFTPRAGLGGILGVLVIGFQRAAFSNEAGAGSASIAHSAVRTRYPASEGVVALLEPFLDTVVICTLTALVVVFFNLSNKELVGKELEFNSDQSRAVAMERFSNDTANQNQIFVYGLKDDKGKALFKNGQGGLGGVELTSAAFQHVIWWFPYVLTIAVVLFAVSTMISWSYYGLQAWKYLFGKSSRSNFTYNILFLAFTVIGASVKLDAVIKFSDAMILALVFPNMIGLILLASHVKKELNRYLDAIGKHQSSNKHQSSQ